MEAARTSSSTSFFHSPKSSACSSMRHCGVSRSRRVRCGGWTARTPRLNVKARHRSLGPSQPYVPCRREPEEASSSSSSSSSAHSEPKEAASSSSSSSSSSSQAPSSAIKLHQAPSGAIEGNQRGSEHLRGAEVDGFVREALLESSKEAQEVRRPQHGIGIDLRPKADARENKGRSRGEQDAIRGEVECCHLSHQPSAS